MFKKILKKLGIPLIAGLFVAGIVSAQIGGGMIGTPSFWTLDGTGLVPSTSTNTIGTSSNRVDKIWADDGDFTTLSFGGLASGDLDMNGNDIVNINGTGFVNGAMEWTIEPSSNFLVFDSNAGGNQFTFNKTANFNSTIVKGANVNTFYGSGMIVGSNTLGDDDVRMTMRADQPLLLQSEGNDDLDFGKGTSADPRFYISSETLYSSATDEWLSWHHDKTRPRYMSGKGASSFGSGTPASLSAENGNDVYITGQLEVDSIGYFDNILKVLSGAIWSGIGRNSGIQFSGTGATRGGLIYNTDEGMSLVAGDSDGNGNHVINHISGSNQLLDHDNDFYFDDPTDCWFSATSPDSNNQQKTCLQHDKTDFRFKQYTGDYVFETDEQKGQSTNIRSNTESISFSANPGDASISTSSLIPDGAFLLGLSTRVTTTATNCTSVDIGDGTDDDMFGATTAITQNSTTDNSDATAQFAMSPAIGAQDVTITANGGNCFDGVWAVTAHYMDVTAATSN